MKPPRTHPPASRLRGTVAVVTGASLGIGRGIAQVLAEEGATVYATGRTIATSVFEPPRGHVIPIQCDHTIDSQVNAFFARVIEEQDRLDLLVNNAWGGYENMTEGGEFTWTRPFWEQPLSRWDSMFQSGVRAAYVASAIAARQMVVRRVGLIVNISFWASQKHVGNVPYGVSKAATDKLTRDMAVELGPYGVAAVALYPGLVRTEKVMASAAFLDLTNSESPEFIGRAISALASDPGVARKNGQILVAAALAAEYGFTDLDGTRPRPLTIDDI